MQSNSKLRALQLNRLISLISKLCSFKEHYNLKWRNYFKTIFSSEQMTMQEYLHSRIRPFLNGIHEDSLIGAQQKLCT